MLAKHDGDEVKQELGETKQTAHNRSASCIVAFLPGTHSADLPVREAWQGRHIVVLLSIQSILRIGGRVEFAGPV